MINKKRIANKFLYIVSFFASLFLFYISYIMIFVNNIKDKNQAYISVIVGIILFFNFIGWMLIDKKDNKIEKLG